MAAHLLNPYVVSSGGGTYDYDDTQLFNAMAKDTASFQHSVELATSNSHGIYDCYFLINGVLYSGTTKVKPVKNVLSNVSAVTHRRSEFSRQVIPSECDYVLWNIRKRR
jgi:hypothetical protein